MFRLFERATHFSPSCLLKKGLFFTQNLFLAYQKKLFKTIITMKILKIISCVVLFFSLAQAQEPTAQAPKKRVGNIDPLEKEKYRTRFEAKDSKYFSFGPGFASNMNNTEMLYALAFGYEWEVGAQGALLAELSGIFGDGTSFGNGGIGGKYFFSDEDTSLFAKGLFGFGIAKAKGVSDTTSGFSGKVGMGMTFFRTSTKHLEVSADYTTVFKSADSGTPGVFVLSLALLY
tara:strand:+ start:10163 stop:10855 length:693 start_codon:yes stop_codon:yes gene_type:complete